MVMMCSTPISPKISFDVLKDHALQDVSRYTKNTQRGLNRIQQWYDDPGNYEFNRLLKKSARRNGFPSGWSAAFGFGLVEAMSVGA